MERGGGVVDILGRGKGKGVNFIYFRWKDVRFYDHVGFRTGKDELSNLFNGCGLLFFPKFLLQKKRRKKYTKNQRLGYRVELRQRCAL